MKEDKVIRLARKLLALTKDGSGAAIGEAESAMYLLKKLLADHNMTIDDIDEDVKRKCEYDILPKHHELFFALCWEVIPNWNGFYWHRKSNNRYIAVELTVAEQLELTAKFDHYARDFDNQYRAFLADKRRQMKMFCKAYISKQEITTHPDTDTSGKTSGRGYSSADIMAMLRTAGIITENRYKKQLETKLLANG